jgi:hypothetical protein
LPLWATHLSRLPHRLTGIFGDDDDDDEGGSLEATHAAVSPVLATTGAAAPWESLHTNAHTPTHTPPHTHQTDREHAAAFVGSRAASPPESLICSAEKIWLKIESPAGGSTLANQKTPPLPPSPLTATKSAPWDAKPMSMDWAAGGLPARAEHGVGVSETPGKGTRLPAVDVEERGEEGGGEVVSGGDTELGAQLEQRQITYGLQQLQSSGV